LACDVNNCRIPNYGAAATALHKAYRSTSEMQRRDARQVCLGQVGDGTVPVFSLRVRARRRPYQYSETGEFIKPRTGGHHLCRRVNRIQHTEGTDSKLRERRDNASGGETVRAEYVVGQHYYFCPKSRAQIKAAGTATPVPTLIRYRRVRYDALLKEEAFDEGAEWGIVL
jgi:hypothetical protein